MLTRYNIRCKKQVDAQKQLKIQQEPLVLIIQLKRFGFMHNFGSKMNNHVAFDHEFDLAPFMKDKNV
jgi:ubiquitin C-terminal hydrolase